MFIYDKKIDRWSHKMIKNLTEVWGVGIPQKTRRDSFKTLPFLQQYLNEYIREYGEEIFLKFLCVTGIKYVPKNFGYFLNTTPVSLHNAKDKYISIGLHHEFASYPTVVIHELFHIFFYEYVETLQFRAALNKARIEYPTEHELDEIKEIVTVIINDVFQSIIDTSDAGYPNHQISRTAVFVHWCSERNFKTVILNAIEAYKKSGQS